MSSVDLVMPKLGESIMEATILKWHKKPGKWQFVKALQGAKDLSAEMKMFYIKKKPITLLYDKDGKITYPADAEAELKIKEGYWEFFPGAKRDLKIKTITVDGSAQESFKLVSVTEKEMIYEETRSKTKYYFKRVKSINRALILLGYVLLRKLGVRI